MKVNLSLIMFCLLLGSVLHAVDLGVMGKCFPVLEENFSQYLLKQMQGRSREEFLKKQEAAKRRLVFLAKHPSPVLSLREAKEYRAFSFDPSYTAQEEIKDHQGKVIIYRGDRVNPLNIRALSRGLLFFDGENDEHLAWAKKQSGYFKWVLTKGSPIELEERERIPVYFDQGGKYTTHFHIQHIPAKITQSGSVLVVEEIPIKLAVKEVSTSSKTQQSREELAVWISKATASIDPDAQLVAQTEKKCSASSELFNNGLPMTESGSNLCVFISFSVPIESWKDLSSELEKTEGVFVLNGIPQSSFQEFILKVTELRKLGVNAPIQIDPLAFEKYGIEHVPAFVFAEGQSFNKVVGNIPLSTALGLFPNRRIL